MSSPPQISTVHTLAASRDAFARVCAANPALGISGFKCPGIPGPFSDADIDKHAGMFARCVAWLKAFSAVAPGVNVESDLARDCQMAWQRRHGDHGFINHGVFVGACYHLGLAGPRRRGRPDIFIELRLGAVLLALDCWSGQDDGLGHPALDAVERALEKLR